MELYTFQLARWRLFRDTGVTTLDTTVKSGHANVAPTWDLVLGIKQQRIDEAYYTRHYLDFLEYSFHHDVLFWESLLATPRLALGCYCASGKFCHRHLLAQFIAGLVQVDSWREVTCHHDLITDRQDL